MTTALLVIAALVFGAIFGASFVAALGKFVFDLFKGLFQFSFELSGCIIRALALLLGLGLLFWCMSSCQGG